MSSKVAAALALCATVFATSAARADEPADAPPVEADKPKTEKSWYGYQTLATDGGALALMALAIATDSDSARTGFLVGSAGMYGIAPVVVHGSHGHGLRAAGDLAIRVFMPIVTGAIGAAIALAASDEPSNDDLGLGRALAVAAGGVIGMGTGVVGAMALDAAVLGWEDAPVERTEKKPAPKHTATIAPTVAPTRNGFSAGLSGTF